MTRPREINQLVEKFWETIPPLWQNTRTHIRRVAAEKFQLTVEQFQVLRRIRKGITSVSALAVANQTSRPSVSRVVDVLVNKGLIARQPDLADRRNILLELTDEGQRVMIGIYQETGNWLAQKFNTLTTEERDLACRGMTLLQEAFD